MLEHAKIKKLEWLTPNLEKNPAPHIYTLQLWHSIYMRERKTHTAQCKDIIGTQKDRRNARAKRGSTSERGR